MKQHKHSFYSKEPQTEDEQTDFITQTLVLNNPKLLKHLPHSYSRALNRESRGKGVFNYMALDLYHFDDPDYLCDWWSLGMYEYY